MNKPTGAVKAPLPRATVRRKPQSNVVCIDLAKNELRALMVEQSRDDDYDYITVYRGSRAELVGAGVPEAAFPLGGKGRKFQVRATWPRGAMLGGAMNPVDNGFELEIGWGHIAPSPCGCGHPAIRELARIMLIEIQDWGGPRPWPAGLPRPPDAPPDKSSLWHTFDALTQHWRSCYKGAPASLRISEAFREKLYEYGKQLYDDIQSECEVFVAAGAAREQRQNLSLVVDNTREDAR